MALKCPTSTSSRLWRQKQLQAQELATALGCTVCTRRISRPALRPLVGLQGSNSQPQQATRAACLPSDDTADTAIALLVAGVAPQQLAAASSNATTTSNTSASQQRQAQQHHAAMAAVAAPITTAALPRTPGVWPGMVLGTLITLALQKVWVWVCQMRWAQQVMEALDLRRSSSSGASTSQPDAGAPSGNGSGGATLLDGGSRFDSMASLGSTYEESDAESSQAGVTRITLPDSSELRDTVNSLRDTLTAREDEAGESVEWVNMCWRKAWRVYQRGLERWINDLLQPLFDMLLKDENVPRFVQRLRIVEFTLDHEAPYFTNMRRRYSRKDSDLTGVVDVRYTGGARMLLMLEVGGGRWRFKVPVLVSDLDLDCQMWIKIRLAPMCPWIGTLSLAFVGPPNIKVQLSPYNRVRLMRVPILQNFLRKLLTVDLPGLMVLPKRLEVAIPPSVTSVAEAAVGRDTIMRAVASAVLQADALEQALLAALPLGPQTPAGGISLPEAFRGELDVVLKEARDLPVWGFPGQSNPYVRMSLGEQAVQSRRDDDTSSPGRHRHPVWNQEFQFLVESPETQVLDIIVRDSHLTGRTEVGSAKLSLKDIATNGGERVSMWVSLNPPTAYASRASGVKSNGEVLLEVTYKAFDDDEQDSGYREAQAFHSRVGLQDGEPITDIRSAAAASSRAAVAASAAISAIAMTKAAAARAATRAAKAAAAVAGQAVAAVPGLPQGPQKLPFAEQSMGEAEWGAEADSVTATRGLAGDAATIWEGRSQPSQQQQQAHGEINVVQRQQHISVPVEPALSEQEALNLTASMEVPADTEEYEDGMGAILENIPELLNSTTAIATLSPTTLEVQFDQKGAVVGAYRHKQEQHAQGGSQGPVDKGREEEQGAAGGQHRPPVILEHIQHTEHTAGYPVREHLPPSTKSVNHNHARPASTKPALGPEVAQEPAVTEVSEEPETTNPAVRKVNVQVAATATVVKQRASLLDAGQPDSMGMPVIPEALQEAMLPGVPVSDGAPETNGAHHAPGEHGDQGGKVDGSHAHGPEPPDTSAGQVELGSSSAAVAQVGEEPAVAVLQTKEPGKGGETVQELQAISSSAPANNHQHPPLPLVLNRLQDLGMALGSVWNIAKDTLVPPPKPASGTTSVSEETVSSTEGAAQPSKPSEPKQPGSEGSTDSSWVAPLLAAMAIFTTPAQKPAKPTETAESTAAEGKKTEQEGGEGKAVKEGLKPWWDFWSQPPGSQPEAAAAKVEKAKVDSSTKAAAGEEEGKKSGGSEAGNVPPWWAFWEYMGKGGKDSKEEEERAKKQAGASADGSKPVEAIIIPPDLPLEEIAREVAKLKDESWRSKGEHVENLWAKAVERNDRPWIILCAALLGVACALLAAVAYRLDHFSGSPPTTEADITVPLATLHFFLMQLSQLK